MPKFYNKNGDLSAYSLTCGYIQREERGDIQLDLCQDGIYHVKAYDRGGQLRIMWETFDYLTDARKFFRKARTALRQGSFYDFLAKMEVCYENK